MIKIVLLIVTGVVLGCNVVVPDKEKSAIGVIPEPVSLTVKEGNFLLNGSTRVFVQNREALSVAQFFVDEIWTTSGNKLSILEKEESNSKDAIVFNINASLTGLGTEGYKLEITSRRVSIEATKTQGLFYGLQSFLQLLSPLEGNSNKEWSIPCVSITDYPRFKWRGLMLDVSRHFFSKEFVKKYIDEMAKYKFNIFHFHLTDDQGWRIQVDSYPKLTEVGAWRVPRVGKWWSFLPPQPGEPATYGGFYTKDDIREIVQYAQERFVTVVPEIDVPGHSLAAIAAYPHLSCTKKEYKVNPGSRFYGVEDNALCAGQEGTFEFLDKVFTEVAELFPAEYIHVGGDECFKGFWDQCDACKRRMKENHLANLNELQGYFMERLDKILQKKGKKLIGWDELLEGKVAPNAVVMSWRGMQGGIKAAKMGHNVIMTPTYHTYLDLYQGDPLVEPETYSSARLESCYNFEPVPQDVEEKYILGGQGNLWTESVPTGRHAEYMTWPRGLALSEVYWSPREKRNWDDFIRRMEIRLKDFDKNEINYARSFYDPIISAVKSESDSLKVKLRTEISGLDLHYTFDETNPDAFSLKYENEPLRIPKGASQIKVRNFRTGQPVGNQINCPLSILKDRIETN